MKPLLLTLSLIFLMRWAGAAAAADARENDFSLTLEEFERRAVAQGVRGLTENLKLESAGYTREIARRSTDSPSLTAAHEQTRSESEVNDRITAQRVIKDTTLELKQPTPLGTDINLETSYGDKGDKPGFQATVVQPLYLFAYNPRLITRRRADLDFAYAQMVRDSEILRIRSDARSTYYNVLLGQQSMEVEQRRTTSAKKLLDITQALVDAGRLPPVETMRAKIRLQSSERQTLNAQVTTQKAVADAKNFILYPQDEPLEFASQLAFKPFTIPLQKLIDYAVLHRPELRSARYRVDLSELDVRLAGQATKPAFGVNALYRRNEVPDIVASNWDFGWTASWLFFDSFMTDNAVKRAKTAKMVADLNFQDTERSTRVDVKKVYLDIKRAEKQLQDFTFSRQQAVRNVDVLRLRFQNGLERIIDVFDAENEMRSLDNEFLSILVQFNTSKDSLSRLLGVDVDTLS